MTKEEFLRSVGEVIEAEQPLQPGRDLADYPTWDSLGILSLIDLFEELNITVDLEALSALKTTDELVALAGSAIDG